MHKGEILKRILRKRGITQEIFAGKLNITRNTLHVSLLKVADWPDEKYKQVLGALDLSEKEFEGFYDDWKELYMQALEEMNDLQKELRIILNDQLKLKDEVRVLSDQLQFERGKNLAPVSAEPEPSPKKRK